MSSASTREPVQRIKLSPLEPQQTAVQHDIAKPLPDMSPPGKKPSLFGRLRSLVVKGKEKIGIEAATDNHETEFAFEDLARSFGHEEIPQRHLDEGEEHGGKEPDEDTSKKSP